MPSKDLYLYISGLINEICFHASLICEICFAGLFWSHVHTSGGVVAEWPTNAISPVGDTAKLLALAAGRFSSSFSNPSEQNFANLLRNPSVYRASTERSLVQRCSVILRSRLAPVRLRAASLPMFRSIKSCGCGPSTRDPM